MPVAGGAATYAQSYQVKVGGRQHYRFDTGHSGGGRRDVYGALEGGPPSGLPAGTASAAWS